MLWLLYGRKSELRHTLSACCARSDPNVQRQLLPQEENLLTVNPVSAAWLDFEKVELEEQGGEYYAHLDPSQAVEFVSCVDYRPNAEIYHSLHAYAVPRSNTERIEHGSAVFLELSGRMLQPALRVKLCWAMEVACRSIRSPQVYCYACVWRNNLASHDGGLFHGRAEEHVWSRRVQAEAFLQHSIEILVLLQLGICEVCRRSEIGSYHGSQFVECVAIAHQQVDCAGEQSSRWRLISF